MRTIEGLRGRRVRSNSGMNDYPRVEARITELEIKAVIVDKLTPGDLWKELVEKKNTAVAIFFGAVALGMCLIIAACLHG